MVEERSGDVDEYGQPQQSASQQKLTFEQQKAELKRKIMAQPPKRQKIKKQKKDTVYNPEGKKKPARKVREANTDHAVCID